MSDEQDEIGVDEIATQQARRTVERLFAERKLPGRMVGDLFCFDFADLVVRIEVMTGRETAAHTHMTVSTPSLATPVLDCWVGTGNDRAHAIANAVEQWIDGPYQAYHDALAHDHEPTYVIARGDSALHAFEAPLQGYGRSLDIEKVAALRITQKLLEAANLPSHHERAHRLRWVRGMNDVAEAFLDDEPQPTLVSVLREIALPDEAYLLRNSAVVLPATTAAQRAPHNWSLGDAHDALAKLENLVDVDTTSLFMGSLQHAIERAPSDTRVPALCQRWSQLTRLAAQRSQLDQPLDAPLSRGLLAAYAKMAAGDMQGAHEWLLTSMSRVAGSKGQEAAHLDAIADLFCEFALIERTDAVINAARHAVERNDALRSVGLSSLEAPSAVAALRERFPNVQLSCADLGDPDPRLPRSSSGLALWSYRPPGLWARLRGQLTNDASPAVDAPSQRARDAVAAVAASAYSREAWSRLAAELVRDHGDVSELLAVMVHPPRLDRFTAWDSRFRVIVAAAFALGHLVARDVAASPLVRLLDGPVDWTTTAAAIGLMDLALRRPEHRPAVITEISERMARGHASPVWYQCFSEPALWILTRLLDAQRRGAT